MGKTECCAEADRITVALCSVGRSSLVRTLSAIAAGETGGIHEVIVVDNSSASGPKAPADRDDGTGAIPAEELAKVLAPVPLRVLRGPGPASGGRNLALTHATTDVVLFTDDDCIPSASWAAAMATFMREEPRAAAAFGAVEPVPLAGARIRTVEIPGIGTVAWGEGSAAGQDLWCPAITAPTWARGVAVGEATVPWAIVGSSNNLALRSSLLLPGRAAFLPWLGPGTAAASGEDTEIGYALMAAGRAVAHVPEAVVHHDSWVGPREAEWAKRVYLRGNIEGLGPHVLSGDPRAGQVLQAYLRHFCDVNGFADMGELLEWGYGEHLPGQMRQPMRR